jgi:quinolinate synthase
MADMINAEQLRRFKAEHPGAKAVCYVNSTAEVKAECDICVTSGNAERVMRSFSPDEKILFVPDRHLGSHIAALLGREYELWQGCCPIHAKLTAEDIAKARESHPGAVVMVHPECSG